jgi:UDP-N-acetylglucosamine 1-carboxyvinyltransferase
MDQIRIEGGRRLAGTIRVSGAKNAALPAMVASLLTDQPLCLENLPMVRDVRTMARLLEGLGGRDASLEQGRLRLRMQEIVEPEASYELVKTMRASILVLGPMVARGGQARVSLPGGCAIGERPVDQHLEGLRRLGAQVEVEHGYVVARTDRLRGAEFTFGIETVTGTENLLMAATLARGTTVLKGCAREPEVADLAQLLRAMGARIEGEGTTTIQVEGVDSLSGAEHVLIPDRIEAGTFVIAAALAGDGVTVEGCNPEHLGALQERLAEMGVRLEAGQSSIRVQASPDLQGRDIRTAPHPGFPTDLQAQYMTLATQANGTTVVHEEIFENRFMHVAELRRMGADVQAEDRTAVVRGPTPLSGAQVMATDLRASACLLLAGLVAEGTTVVDRVYHIDRGYERIEEKLGGLGAEIQRVRAPGP